MSKPVIHRVAGDPGPKITAELEGVNITGYAFDLNLRFEDGTSAVIPANIDDASGGLFSFDLATLTNPLEAGRHQFEIVITPPVDPSYTVPTKKPGVLLVREQMG